MRLRRAGKGAGGFTLLAVLLAAVVMGIAAQVAVFPWRTFVKREKEAELLDRGCAIKKALGRYYGGGPGGKVEYPETLKDLLKDPRYPNTRRYLRRLYRDPITGDDWSLIYDGNKRVKGVRSSSEDAPLKAVGFPEGLKHFEGKKKYTEWIFEFQPNPTTNAGGNSPNPTPTPSQTC